MMWFFGLVWVIGMYYCGLLAFDLGFYNFA